MAKTFSSRPSEFLGVSDGYTAYCLDNAVYTFGSTLESELKGVEGKNKGEMKSKTERVLQKWLGIERKFRRVGKSDARSEQAS